MISSIVRNTWSIFLGLSFLMLGNGLQGTITGWRATYEGFSAGVTGLVMTGYYIGFLLGSIISPILVRRVGHIRVFAALASLASASVLIQILVITPPTWFAMRFVTGTCFAGTYVIVESWLNARSDNQTRGRVLSIYMIVTYLSMAGGQWLMNIANPADYDLFMISSILLSLSLVPVLISRIKAPEIELHDKISIPELFAHAPTGTLTLFFVSMAHGAMFSMGAVYAHQAGLDISQTIWFMSSFILFAAVFQWPIGWISDRMDRRITIIATSMIVTVLSLVAYFYTLLPNTLIIVFGVLGATSLVIYSLAIALTNDRLLPEKMVEASSTMVLIYGTGSILGPSTIGFILDSLGHEGFFMHLAITHLIIASVAMFHMFKNPPVPQEEQTPYQNIPPKATMVAMEAIAQETEEAALSTQED
jgi:MFS family permease